MQKLLSKNPNSRPSAAEVLEMPLIRNAREGLAKTGGTIGKKIIRIHNAKLSTAEGASSPQDSSSQTSARVKKKKAQPSVGTKRLQSGLRQAKAPSVSEKKPSNGAKQKSLVNAARFSKVNKHARSHGHSRHPSNFKLSNDRVTLSTAYKLGKEAEKNPYSIDDDQQSSSTDFMLAEAEDRIFNLGLDGGDEGNAPSGNDKPSRANGLEKTPADGPSGKLSILPMLTLKASIRLPCLQNTTFQMIHIRMTLRHLILKMVKKLKAIRRGHRLPKRPEHLHHLPHCLLKG